jgi:hypothetical protein
MTTVEAPPAGATPNVTPPRAASPAQRVATEVRAAASTTPGRYRLLSLATAFIIAVAAVAGTAAGSAMRSATRRAQANSGPVLVATQQLVSSLAEADAAASAAFLSGRNEDPEQRRIYEQALARSNAQLEDIASLAGQDPKVHASLARIDNQLTRYAGLVEAARASNKSGSPDATGYLTDAVRLATDVVSSDVQALTDTTQASLRADETGRNRGLPVAVIVVLAALGVLAYSQSMLTRKCRRLLNVPLVLATVMVLAALVALVRSAATSGDALTAARADGYDSIVITAQLSAAGFGAKAAETLAVITGDSTQRNAADVNTRLVTAGAVTAALVADMRAGATTAPGGLIGAANTKADSPRERAAIAEVAVRWQRYQDTVATLRSAPTPAAARAIAVGAANSDFNGFNFSVESVLGQNREQFLSDLARSARDTRRAPTVALLLLLAAFVVAFWGFQLRINDYR